MSRAYGVTATLGGKKVRWAGDEYGWQSPASYAKLEAKGQFKLGRKELDALTQYLGPLAQTVGNFQQQVRKATPWLDPVERTVNRAMAQDDKLPSSRVAQGGAVLAQKAGNAANLDPRIGMALPFLVGAVHTSGARAGTTKLRAQPSLKIPHDQLEDLVEGGYQHVKQTGGLKGYKQTVQLPDGNEVYVFNRGNIDFDKRNGLTIKTRPSRGQAPVPAKPAPKPVAAPVAAPVVTPSQRSYDPEARFTPTKTESSGLSSGQRRKRDDAAIRNPILPRDLEPSVTTPPVAGGGLAIRAQGPAVKGTALAGERYANAHLSEGSAPVRVRETQAHHEVPLKDPATYTTGMNAEQVDLVRRASEKLGLYFGDTQLNTLYPRQPYHQGDSKWPQAFDRAAHVRLLNSNRPLEAPSGTSRWAQFTVEQRLEMLPEFLMDAIAGKRIGLDALFQQNLLQPGNDAFNNPFIGNLGQQVMAPENKAALKVISDKRRAARATLKGQ